MRESIFITELNYKQVDIFVSDDKHEEIFYVDGEEHTYFNAKIHWGLKLYESNSDIDITPFIDRIEVTSGDGVSDNGMLIVKHDFKDIRITKVGDWNKNGQWKEKMYYLRDDDRIAYRWHILIRPKFVAIDIDKKVVEVIFNA